MTARALDLRSVRLGWGVRHPEKLGMTPEEAIRLGKASLLEVVSYLAGESWSAQPACVAPVLAPFGDLWKLFLADREHQQLVQYIPLLIDTAGDTAADDKRAFMALDW